MAEGLLAALRDDLDRGVVTVVVGAGVSVSVSGGSPAASWLGLLRSGIDWAVEYNQSLPPAWRANVESDLDMGEAGHGAFLTSAADKITDALGGRDGGEFKAWLRATVGKLEAAPHERRLVEAIGGLGAPIVTTNYDSLLEQGTGRSAVTWLDPSAAQLVIRGGSSQVLHMHGHWESPLSLVFGAQSYGQVLGDEAAQSLQRAMGTLKSLLFIGCGAGLDDPNFAALRRHLKDVLGKAETRHYRLCRSSERAALAVDHTGERISPVSYGDEYSDLSSFLLELRPEASSGVEVQLDELRTAVPRRAFDAICEKARAETVLADHLPDVNSRQVDRLLVPPVLLPMSQEQFAVTRELDRDVRPSRCDPQEDVQEQSKLLLVADENTGLTSALEWLVASAHLERPSLSPVLVDFRTLGAGRDPLARQVRKELSQAGAVVGPKDRLPACALAVDNVLVKPEKIFERMVGELREGPYPFVVVGCRTGNEAELHERFAAAGIDLTIRYVGRMTTKDAMRLAGLVVPHRAERLAREAIEIADREHLARTPLTLGLLISVLLQGESLLGTASETALLDAYVNLLLGRGDPHDDARFSLDAHERADILGCLAEGYVAADAGSLSLAELVKALENYFDTVGWDENAVEVFNSLRARRLLAVQGNQVRFSQSSFLHLFAAKRAVDSPEFRERLYARPLYYAPIIRHYAALTRNDPEVLKRVEELLGTAADVQTEGRSFKLVEQVNAPTSVEELVAQLAIPEGPDRDDARVDTAAPSESDHDVADHFDVWFLEERDPDPFPVEEIENAPPLVRVVTTLGLVSNVLRDSELVKDLVLKERVLFKLLAVWGKFVELLEDTEDFQQFMRALAQALAESLIDDPAERPEFVTDFVESSAVLSGMGGMSATLASRKLARPLHQLFEGQPLLDSVGASVMGALLGFELQQPGWAEHFRAVEKRHGDVYAVSSVMRRFGLAAYYSPKVRPQEIEALHEFLVDLYARRLGPMSDLSRKARRAEISQKLRKNRATLATRTQAPKKELESGRAEISARSQADSRVVGDGSARP